MTPPSSRESRSLLSRGHFAHLCVDFHRDIPQVLVHSAVASELLRLKTLGHDRLSSVPKPSWGGAHTFRRPSAATCLTTPYMVCSFR